MRTLLAIMLFMASNVMLAQSGSFIKKRPKPAHVVNDFGNFLSTSDEQTLENDLIAYRKKSGKSIVIITLPSLTDNTGYTWTIEDAATQYFDKWSVGSRIWDNGVLILVSKNPHRVRIAVGKGIEYILTNEVCQQILDNAILPDFKLSFYYNGLKEGVKDIESTLSSGKFTSRANNLSSANSSAQVDTQALTQTNQQLPVAAKPKEVSKTKKVLRWIVTPLLLIVIMWLRVKWVTGEKLGGKDTATAAGSTVATRRSNWTDYINAIGWIGYWVIKIYWWAIVFTFGCIAIFFGFNVWKRGGFRFFKYPGGRTATANARAIYDGGQTNGGGASGSW